jgi:hypothetical protein
MLGGTSTFNFLKHSTIPQLTALGGVNVSQPGNDAGLAFYNPALLKESMHTQMNAVFDDHYGGISVYHLSMAYHLSSIQTSFQGGLNYFNYGKVSETDASGNEFGQFRPTDWALQLSASRVYLEKWSYGATLKFIQSHYGSYRANGMALDMGILFTDSASKLTASFLVQNLGTQFTSYGGVNEELPFDIKMGVTKRLEGAPFSFSLTAQRLNRFNIDYEDTTFNNDNGYANRDSRIGKIFRHLVLATTVYFGDRAEMYAGYNFLRRKELAVGAAGNGLHGFSMGLGVFLGKLRLRYGRAYFQPGAALNQLGISMKLNDYFGLGKFGDKISW